MTFAPDPFSLLPDDNPCFATLPPLPKAAVPHTDRVHGPTFVIEFLNNQKDSAGNPANHSHSVWRSLAGDYCSVSGSKGTSESGPFKKPGEDV
jgi:hypothetical protein